MSKSTSGHFSGTKGNFVNKGVLTEAKNGSRNPVKEFEAKVSNVKSTMTSSGNISASSIRENAGTFTNNSAYVYATALQDMGYNVSVKSSAKSRSGAQIITISNSSKERNISQVQVSPGGGRHGASPYVKIITTDNGKFKIVDGPESEYKSNAKETAEIIFRRKK